MSSNAPQATTFSLRFLTISMNNLKIFKLILCCLQDPSPKEDSHKEREERI